MQYPRDENPRGGWAMDLNKKANEFADFLQNKFVSPTVEINEYSELGAESQPQKSFSIPGETACRQLLFDLDKTSGTGPDDIPAMVLIICARELARAILILGQRILETGVWPEVWRLHRLVPLYKKLSRHELKNYRAIHLTAHISKTLERFISLCTEPYIVERCLYGPTQWAYQRRKGARDALAFLVIRWLLAISRKKKIVLFCADVAGAFDRVQRDKLVKKNSRPKAFIQSWFESSLPGCRNGGRTWLLAGPHPSRCPWRTWCFRALSWGPVSGTSFTLT